MEAEAMQSAIQSDVAQHISDCDIPCQKENKRMIDDYKMEAGKGENEEADWIPLPHIFWKKSGQKEAIKNDRSSKSNKGI